MRILLLTLLFLSCCAIPTQTGEITLLFCQVDDCKQGLLTAINNSEEIKCAFYDLDYDPLEQLLKHKNVEVLVFKENYDGFGISVKASHGGLMHDKFCILDERIVITGSTNPTANGLFKNDNGILIIEGEVIAQNYLDEFEELKGKKEQQTRNKKIKHKIHEDGEGFLIENYFCPEDDCEKQVLEELGKAITTIHFMTFSFTSDPIGKLLIEKAKDGILVQGVFEKRQQNAYSEYQRLLAAGLDVRFDSNPQTMHHKVFIIDGKTVIMGSYNPTKNGNTRNDENVLIIHNQALTARFRAEFDRLWLLTNP
ncbi:hypothetical protein GOV07_05305 [Candidatus Woesearchaeota archaeon]|nr:hypothetical protein [Candidatus Woesearchaeota archaeon]